MSKIPGQGLRGWLLRAGTPVQPVRVSESPYAFYDDGDSFRKRGAVSALTALSIHVLLFTITLPNLTRKIAAPEVPLALKKLVAPSGAAPRSQALPRPRRRTVQAQKRPVPIPAPTPRTPKPIGRRISLAVSATASDSSFDLDVGDVEGPFIGTAPGPSIGPNSEPLGESPMEITGGVTNPVVLHSPAPSYTDEAIRAGAEGFVILRAVIRKDGNADSFQVIRALGYGLDESAIREIANNWKFRPGTYQGRAVDVYATIEIRFSLQ